MLGAPNLLDFVPADGVAIDIAGEYRSHGSVPSPNVVSTLGGWARDADDEIPSTDFLSRDLADLAVDLQLAAGALTLNLPDGQYAIWLRGEVLPSVDWGGDPHNKSIAVSEAPRRWAYSTSSPST